MRLERVEASGFFHFAQQFKLDCRHLPEGLIAVIGQNGAGKTSLALDSPIASIFGPGCKSSAFPSRDGSLLTYATSKSAYLQTVWTLEGKGEYIARVNVDRQTRKTDAVLVQVIDGARTPLNDGLVTTFRQVVDSLFPSLRSILASAYAAQNRRGGFGQLNQSDRIALFRELADLAHLEEKAQTAKRCQQIADEYVDRLTVEIQTLERDISPDRITALDLRLGELSDAIAETRVAIETAAQRISVLQSARPLLAKAAEQHIAESARLDHVTQAMHAASDALVRHRQDMASVERTHETRVGAIQQRFIDGNVALDKRTMAMARQYEETANDKHERIKNNELVLSDAFNIRAAVDKVRAAETSVGELRTKLGQVRLDLDLAREQVTSRGVRLAECLQSERDLTTARQRGAMVKQIKFGENCTVEPTCPLVVDVRDAIKQIPELEGLVAHKATLEQGIAHWQSKVDDARKTILKIEQEIAAHEQSIREHTTKANLAPHLTHAEDKIAEYRRDLEQLRQQHDAALNEIVSERSQLESARFNELQAENALTLHMRETDATKEESLSEAVRSATQQRDAVSASVAATAHAAIELRAVDDELSSLANRRETQAATLARAQTEHESLTKECEAIAARANVVTGLRDKLRVLQDESLAWGTLARACGRDGLQRLEIDAAGPVVSDLANALLQVGYGTRFSIELVTQVATADGKDVKEKFTIDAIDNANGGDRRDIGDLSGGERVVVEEAVRAALQCYVSLRSRQPSRTIWRDETTGALDPENAPKYVAMLRKMREISHAHQVFFVTHSMECARLADAQVQVHDGQATIVLPPFRETP